jgi:hypothetical protein
MSGELLKDLATERVERGGDLWLAGKRAVILGMWGHRRISEIVSGRLPDNFSSSFRLARSGDSSMVASMMEA